MIVRARNMRLDVNHRAWRWIVALAMVVMALRIASTWHVFNDVIDEPYHLGAGVAMLEAGRHVYGIQHPPLPRIVGALPLVLGGIDSGEQRVGQVVDDLRAFEVGHHALLGGRLSYWDALVRARAAMLLFPLLAVLYVYFIGRYLANRLVGCAAAIFFSTDPTLLGHGALVTTDAAACAAYLAATYHGLRFIARPSPARMLIAGVAVGLALACKFSCVLVLPGLALVWLLRGRRAVRTFARVAPLGAGALVIALVMLWTTYAFDIGRIDELRIGGSDATVVAQLPPWMRQTPLPMPTAIVGYLVLARHNALGHFAYLNGEVSQTGWWCYFPQAIALKSPVALLIGIALATVVMILSKHRRPLRTAAVLVPFGVFLLASMTAGINIGVRHVLPAIPFLYLFVSIWLARTRWLTVIASLVSVAIIETAVLHPDYLAYFNIFAGGPRNGERYLLDSNLDWGQDMWRLHTWLRDNARGRVVTLRLFGNPRLHQWPHGGYILAPPTAPPQGLFAISKNYLYDVYPNPGSAWLRRLEPVARIGYSIEVYDLDAQPRQRSR